jgi:phosphoribosylamine-glycine ligase
MNLKGKKLLVLGAGLWQMPYIIKARELGCYISATDWNENPEGKKYVNCFRQIDLKNLDESLRFAREQQVEAIFTNADIGVPTAAYIAEKLGLYYHSREQAEVSTNKFLMRNTLSKIGLNTPQYRLVQKREDVINSYKEFSGEVIIKPVDNCSSRGVYIANTVDDVNKYSHDSFKNSFIGNILIEELMVGIESSVEVIVDKGEPIVLGWCKKQKSNIPYRYDLQLDYFPDYPDSEHKEVWQMVNQLIYGLGIKMGILHIEFIWTSEGIKIIEFALRGCGSNVTTHLIPNTRGFDLSEYLILNSFNKSPKVILPKNSFGVLKFIIPKPGKIKAVRIPEMLKKKQFVNDFRLELSLGQVLDEIKDGRSRPGHYIVTADTREEIFSSLNYMDTHIKIEYDG